MNRPPSQVAVLGAGPVGTVTAAGLAALDHAVLLVDPDAARLAPLRAGKSPYYEPGLDALLAESVRAGRLAFAAEPSGFAACGIAFVCVGTPETATGEADLTMVHAAVDGAAKILPRSAIVVLRSTVPPGTGDAVAQRLATAGRSDLAVVNAPEFLAEGTAVADFQRPARLLFGGPREAAERVAALFAALPASAPRIVTDRRTAELSKYASNVFLAARVSLINEVANLCDALGADVRQVAQVVGLDPRIGPNFLRPGLGYGGSCFPKDVKAIAALADRVGSSARVLRAVEATNEAQWRIALAKLQGAAGELRGRTVAILGIAFKPGTDDTRRAPGLRLMQELVRLGASVRAHDPVARLPPELAAAGVTQSSSAAEALRGAHGAVLVTEWDDYRRVDWIALAKTMAKAVVVDARNALDGPALARAGVHYQGIGLPKVAP